MPALTCVHAPAAGLCPECQAAYDEDAISYIEYGDHEAGLRNWAALEAELAARPAAVGVATDDEIPF